MTFEQWLAAFCRAMGWPVTGANLEILTEWARLEGRGNPAALAYERGFNPFMTTMPGFELANEELGFGRGIWNSAGVKIYGNAQAGIDATVATFRRGGGPSWYGALDEAFRTQTWNEGVLRSWQIWIVGPNAAEAHAYDVDLDAFARGRWEVAGPVAPPDPIRALLEDVLLSLFAGSEQGRNGEVFDRQTRLAYARSRAELVARGEAASVVEIAASAGAGIREHIANHAAGIHGGVVPDHTHEAGRVKR